MKCARISNDDTMSSDSTSLHPSVVKFSSYDNMYFRFSNDDTMNPNSIWLDTSVIEFIGLTDVLGDLSYYCN